MTLILVFIIVLNIIAIALTYYCLSDLEKKDKVIFIAVCVAIIYMLTTFVYWISTKSVAVKEVSDLGKNLITFLFVPINTLVVVPLFAKSYNKYKTGFLAFDKLRNRGILLGAILFIILIIAEIKSAIIIIDLVFAPAQTIISGPSATLGKLFSIVKNGSNTLDRNLLNHNILAKISPIKLPIIKLIIISYKVVKI